jgi:hypothetical protein
LVWDPPPHDAAFWDDLGARFENAEKLLAADQAASEHRSSAKKYAEAARATAKALRSKQ